MSRREAEVDTRGRLLARLDEIGRALARSGHALALLGLGSVGLELERLDDYSDLDFFVLVEAGHKRAYLEHLDWLSAAGPIAYAFRNTPDGYKLLFQDGIFCEFGVFEPAELSGIPFTPGRLVWKRADVDEAVVTPARTASAASPPSDEWLLGEALTNLYVGLGRFHRGEKLSAARFIQGYAVDRVLELAERLGAASAVARDPFAVERRAEQRLPGLAEELPRFVQGYARSRQSARAILEFLERHFPVDAALSGRIRALLEGPSPASRGEA